MDTLLKSLEQTPALLAMVIMLTMFIRYLTFMGVQQIDKDKEYAKTINNIVEKHTLAESKAHDSREVLAQAIRDNSRITEKLTEAMEHNTCKYQGGKR